MAELDPIVAKILLKGDDEFLKGLENIGSKFEESIGKLTSAVAKGEGPLTLLGGLLNTVEAAVSGITAVMIVFIEQQTELTQKTQLLAEAFGTTTGQLQEIEAVFASSGVKVEQFERFATRLTTTIAREWPQIAESIKTYATENDAATLRVVNATIRIRDAQNAVADNAEARGSAIANSYLSVQSATLGVVSALQNLRTVEGGSVSDSEKLNLKRQQAIQAVAQARQAEADAERKLAKEEREDAEQAQKDQNAVKEAIIARAEAEEKAAKLALTSISSIEGALKGILTGNKDAATAIDLTAVSVDNLKRGVIALAAEQNGGKVPEGYQALQTITNLLTADTGHLIDRQQRLALVTRLAGTSMQALGASASEILDVLENDADGINKITQAGKTLNDTVDPTVIRNFRGALADLNLTISVLNQQFASAAAPIFTAILKGIDESIKDSNGSLHLLIDGVKAFGAVLGFVKDAVVGLGTAFDEALGANVLAKGTGLKVLLTAIVTVIGLISGPLIAIPILIGLITAALGYVYENFDKVKNAVKDAWQSVADNGVIAFLGKFIDNLKVILSYLGLINAAKASATPGSEKTNEAGAAAAARVGAAAQADGNSTDSGLRFAGGGRVDGPGTPTSDSILARLSRGEFVVKAAAVQNYGEGLFHALNSMSFPGFALGGLVPAPVRMAGGGSVHAASVLNLTIGDRTFNGLRGPKNVVDDLSSFAISRQTSAAGSNPSWMK